MAQQCLPGDSRFARERVERSLQPIALKELVGCSLDQRFARALLASGALDLFVLARRLPLGAFDLIPFVDSCLARST